MKKAIFTAFTLFTFSGIFAQGTIGLIAHWNMNGNANDASGRGHTGHKNNVVLGPGKNGHANQSYYFNGTNSSITAGYLPDLNMNKFSICATFKATGFYAGDCHANSVVSRGNLGAQDPGHFNLYFADLAVSDCSTLDTNSETFFSGAGTNYTTTMSVWNHSPKIASGVWYNVVVTFDSTYWRIYINDTLKSTVLSQSYPMGTSTDSLAIGKDIYAAAIGYPYYFKGYIDDIKIYNRALADSEIHKYTLSTDSFSTTAVAELDKNISNDLIVFPNPATNTLYVAYENKIANGKLELVNQIGQVVMKQGFDGANTSIDISGIANGMYFIKVTTGEQALYSKFIKQ